jgi:peptidoglycan/LPS O-acetylase OafA/YrhL
LQFRFIENRAWRIACGVAFTAIFVARHVFIPAVAPGSTAEEAPGFCTHALNWIPLASFLIAVAAYGTIPETWKDAAVRRTSMLVTMGRHSLALFLAHFALCYGIWYEYAGLEQVTLTNLDYYGIPFLAVAFLMLLGQTIRERNSKTGRRAPTLACRPLPLAANGRE